MDRYGPIFNVYMKLVRTICLFLTGLGVVATDLLQRVIEIDRFCSFHVRKLLGFVHHLDGYVRSLVSGYQQRAFLVSSNREGFLAVKPATATASLLDE